MEGIGLEENDGTVDELALAGTDGSGHCYQYMVNQWNYYCQIHADSISYFNGGNVGIGMTTHAYVTY